mmetsp:Transcript_44166/g.127526  ORF Transcript_44166/g.127526 Transcript_44166/m.127526 type:complete len:1295 (-) Transcript_44166:231-4115(-)
MAAAVAAGGAAPPAPGPSTPGAEALPAVQDGAPRAKAKAKARAQSAAGDAAPSVASSGNDKSEDGDMEDDEEEEEDEEGEAAAEGRPRKRGAFGRISRFFRAQGLKKLGKSDLLRKGGDDSNVNPQDRMRAWELRLAIRSFNYVGSEDSIDTFFAFSLIPIDARHTRSRIRLLPEYSPAAILKKNDPKTLDNPAVIWPCKVFKLPYRDLDKFVLKVAMWKVSKLSFNTYIGRGDRALEKIVWRDANTNFAVKEKMTREQEERRRKKKMVVGDVAMLGLTINCEEIFDFQLKCENWSLEMNKEHPLWKSKREKEKKSLTFVVPKNKFSMPSKGHKCNSTTVKWMGPESEKKCVWPTVDPSSPFVFRGTRTALQNQYFIIKVHSAKVYNEQQPALKAVGSALMNLTSVLDISVFSARVKHLNKDEEYFLVGMVTGSVKVLMYSMNCKTLDNIKGGRPQQPKSAATVGHLNRSEQHLVVKVFKCDGLAVADHDTASSDPYLRCSWDNMLQRSPVLKETVRPVFNFTFYFPVRLFNLQVKKKMYIDTALQYELESKGDIKIQVWDDDDTSSDSLGFFRLTLADLLKSKPQTRTLLGSVASAGEEDEDVEAAPRSKQWFEVEREVRVFDGAKTELTGCSLPNPKTPLIFFEAYFYPDWDSRVSVKHSEETTKENKWLKKMEEFNHEGVKFVKKYAEAFPDAIGAFSCVEDPLASRSDTRNALRRFTCLSKHPQTMDDLPLMAFPSRITTPEEYLQPPVLLHWVSCFTFSSSSRQDRTGRIPEDGWKDPQTFLFTKKGPVQDHALLLCSVLLGSKQDAYVCKGMIHVTENDGGDGESKKRLIEHVWVMTREADGWVTFWEPCTRELYHLPNRWEKQSVRVKRKRKAQAMQNDTLVAADDESDKDDDPASGALVLANEIPDEILGIPDLEALPAVARMPKPKAPTQGKRLDPREKARQEEARRKARQLVEPKYHAEGAVEGALVDWLPYDSIDVVFNDTNLWANRQNHHPACITYNFEEITDEVTCENPGWFPFLAPKDPKETEQEPGQQSGKEVQDEYEFDPIEREAVIDAAYPAEWIERREVGMVGEIEENLRTSRAKLGMDTYCERPQKLQAQLTQFLTLMEKMFTLDVDFCPCLERVSEFDSWDPAEKFMIGLRCGISDSDFANPEMRQEILEKLESQRCNHGSAFTKHNERYMNYASQQEQAWNKLRNDLFAYKENAEHKQPVIFLVPKGQKFTGMPIHFCTSDKEDIRSELMKMPDYDKMVNEREATSFIIHCKMFPLLGGVQSVWLYIGMYSPS